MRSNEQIEKEVLQQIRWNSTIHDSSIEVTVDHNTVTLSGSVPDRESKMAAYEVAQKVPGVKRVVQLLKVVPIAS